MVPVSLQGKPMHHGVWVTVSKWCDTQFFVYSMYLYDLVKSIAMASDHANTVLELVYWTSQVLLMSKPYLVVVYGAGGKICNIRPIATQSLCVWLTN